MFPYFGRKATLAKLYPRPAFDTVIEPFAGSMAYTMHHRPLRAIGKEADDRVVDLWTRPIAPDTAPPVLGSKTDWLLPKLCSYSEHALTSGTMTVTSRMLRDWPSVIRRLVEGQAWAATHLEIAHADYRTCPDIEATWFIDPPYQHANRRGYLHGARGVDFTELAEWCRSRRGQVIVCEQAGADWLPFVPLADIVSHRGVRKSEVVWIGGTVTDHG